MSTPEATTLTGRRGFWRWAVALFATVALVLSGSGLVVFAQSGAGESKGPQFVPADAPIYIEARLDMPAGQREALAQMMTAFPGFADAGMFDTKMDEVINGLFDGGMPEGDIIGDALTGEIGIAVMGLEAAMANEEPGMLMGMPIADPALAEAMAESLASGEVMAAETGSDMVDDVMGDTAVVSDVTSSAAVHGDWMLFSNDPELLDASMAVLDGTAASLADDPDFIEASSLVPEARLGAAYIDMTSFGSLIEEIGGMAEGQTGMALPIGDLSSMLAETLVGYVAAEDDGLIMEAFMRPGEATPEMPVGESELANVFPAETQMYVEMRELGALVENALTGLGEMMAAQAELAPAGDDMGAMGGLGDIEMLLGEDSPLTSMLGVPLPQFLDVVEDASIGAGVSSDGVWLGIAGEVSDDAAATTRVGKIATLITLFGGDPAETGVSVSEEMVGDVEVTTISLPVDDASGSGLGIDVGDSISMAVADGTLLIGLGDFVQSALASDGADSLGTSAAYVDALGEDTVNGGVMYVNMGSLVSELDPLLAMMSPEWTEIAPYAAGLDRMIAVTTADDEVIGMRMNVFVGQ